jgi:hypothetical protein
MPRAASAGNEWSFRSHYMLPGDTHLNLLKKPETPRAKNVSMTRVNTKPLPTKVNPRNRSRFFTFWLAFTNSLSSGPSVSVCEFSHCWTCTNRVPRYSSPASRPRRCHSCALSVRWRCRRRLSRSSSSHFRRVPYSRIKASCATAALSCSAVTKRERIYFGETQTR